MHLKAFLTKALSKKTSFNNASFNYFLETNKILKAALSAKSCGLT